MAWLEKAWDWVTSIAFATEWLAWASLGIPVLIAVLHGYDRARRRQLASRLGELPVLVRVMATISPGRRVTKDVLGGLGAMALVLAIARPQIEGKRKIDVHGLDLVVAVDVSKSMLVDDVGPTDLMRLKNRPANRLERAREMATWMIDLLPGDRVGPVVFAGAASHFPLTEDHEVAVRFLNDLGPADLPQGSNLDEVIRVSRCILRPDLYNELDCSNIGRRGHGGDPLHGESLDPDPKSTRDKEEAEERLDTKVERGKAIVLFTDGGDVEQKTIQNVQKASEVGIAVFVVGVGTAQGGVVYDIDPWTGKRGTVAKKLPDGSTVISKRDDASMRLLAQAGGDEKRYFIASERGELDPAPLVTALQAVNRGLATKKIKAMKDVFQPFLFAGLMLLLLEVAISTRRRLKHPEAA
ncbi:MAG: VWA domain-containing protein [Kofleriaceae bacterium]